METIQNDAGCEGIRLCDQICFPLYACAKEVIRQYRKPLEALDLTYTQYIVMMVLWECALAVPGQMDGCIDLPTEELMQLKYLLDKALVKMGRTRTLGE